MVVASIAGTFIVGFACVPAGYLGRQLGDLGCSPWLALAGYIVLGVTVPIYITVYLFWRMTPGTPGGPVWRLIRRRRCRQGLCVECGYDLTGNTSGVCPECGTPVTRESQGGRTDRHG